ncbi:MAG: C40 family peptidase, partial [Ferruginibacter sp.]
CRKNSLMIRVLFVFVLFSLIISSCSSTKKAIKNLSEGDGKTSASAPVSSATKRAKTFTTLLKIDRKEFVAYAKTFLGTPYKYGSATPENGLDCSGFITVVFNHFKVKAPRTSVSFTDEGTEIDIKNTKPGDIILFTGSDNSAGIVGHMGIITKGGEVPQFIHSASGKNIGVIINNFSGYYRTHFVKVIRILE